MTTAALLLLGYLSLLALMYVAQRNLLFAGRNRDPVVVVDARPVSVRNGPVTLHGYTINPDRDDAILYFGGNREHATDNLDRLRAMLPHLTGYLFDYRGYGFSEGSPSEADLYGDALRIHDWIAIRHRRVFVIGRSLGSGIAVYVAAHRPTEKLLLITPYDSVARVAAAHYPLLPVRFLIKDRFESWRYAPAVSADTLIVKAESDRVIPHRHTDTLIRAFGATRPRLEVIANTRHDNIVEAPEFALALRGFLRCETPSSNQRSERAAARVPAAPTYSGFTNRNIIRSDSPIASNFE